MSSPASSQSLPTEPKLLTISEEQARNALKWKVDAIAKRNELAICDSTNSLLRKQNRQYSTQLKIAHAENWGWRLLAAAVVYFGINSAIRK